MIRNNSTITIPRDVSGTVITGLGIIFVTAGLFGHLLHVLLVNGKAGGEWSVILPFIGLAVMFLGVIIDG